jgi:hypothetical protein
MGNPNESWAQIGAYVVNARMNVRPTHNRVKRGLYKIYHAKKAAATASYI